ncbi:MAG: protease modulator HflC [Opitutae bacterium]|nr:protease modulator HflC [Opitutae bacterium]
MSRLQLLFRVLIALAVAAALGFTLCSFQVASHEAVVLTRFGSPVATIVAPGLHGKWPWPIDTVNRFDTRLAFQETRISEALTRDKRNVIVPLYLAWRIADPLKFLQSTGTPDAVAAKLDSLATSARNTLLGRVDFAELVNADAARVKLPALEKELGEVVRPQALAAFGIAIEEVGLRRIALPEANTVFVFERMRAERAQHAARYRAEGRREAAEIRTQADTEKTVLLADAQRYAEETRGRAEAEAARTYAAAHAQAPDLYRLTRELEALRASVTENTTLVLDTATPPFTALQSPAATPNP